MGTLQATHRVAFAHARTRAGARSSPLPVDILPVQLGLALAGLVGDHQDAFCRPPAARSLGPAARASVRAARPSARAPAPTAARAPARAPAPALAPSSFPPELSQLLHQQDDRQAVGASLAAPACTAAVASSRVIWHWPSALVARSATTLGL